MDNIYIKTNEHSMFDYYFQNKDIVSIKEILDIIEDQYFEIERLQERIADLELRNGLEDPNEYEHWEGQALEGGIL